MLADLPTELLDQIIAHIPTASSVSHLSQSSKALHEFVLKEGWRTFAQTRFPSLDLPPYHRDVSHALTTLSRNWDRRAFLARYVEPSGDIRALPSGNQRKRWRRPMGQSMGFQPAIDSFEQFTGNRWIDRREILAFSTGAELAVRIKAREEDSEQGADGVSHEQSSCETHDSHGNRLTWWTYRPFSSVEGRDDITSINILKSHDWHRRKSDDSSSGDHVIISTANGDLQLLEIPASSSDTVIKTYFVTNGRPVRSSAVWTGTGKQETQLVANLSDNRIALYPLDTEKTKIAPLSDINAIPNAKRGCRIWSTRFLSEQHLGIGLGPSVEPVHVFTIRPDGFGTEPIRKFGLRSDVDDRLDSLGTVKSSSSVYPLEPLVGSAGGKGDGHVFLSGGYDGVIRLHDMRSSSAIETTYRDPTDDSAIYSLLARGLDRFVAGTARHSLLKVFDLRMAGASDYDYSASVGSSTPTDIRDGTFADGHDWNVFINPRDRYSDSDSRRGPNHWMRRSAESPIYSLSSPSPTSALIFAGVENAVVEFSFTSVLDRSPDPVFAARACGASTENVPMFSDRRQVAQTRNSEADVLNLAMYAQGNDSTKATKLQVQRSIADTLREQKQLIGLDERWRDTTNERR